MHFLNNSINPLLSVSDWSYFVNTSLTGFEIKIQKLKCCHHLLILMTYLKHQIRCFEEYPCCIFTKIKYVQKGEKIGLTSAMPKSIGSWHQLGIFHLLWTVSLRVKPYPAIGWIYNSVSFVSNSLFCFCVFSITAMFS